MTQGSSQQKNRGSSKLRVLMQNRPNTFSQRGGDTVVMERLVEGLKLRGVSVTVDCDGSQNPAEFDLVHLFNFALPPLTKMFAQRAAAAGVPYVVTTLCEDISRFHSQSHAVSAALIEYQKQGQDHAWYDRHRVDPATVSGCAPFENSWTAQHAAALFTNGSRESEVIQHCYPGCAETRIVPLGYEVGEAGSKELFIREHGLADFVLCVGRFESRKNQLMLLKALEHSDIPLVLVSGGFSYQPDYDAAVRGFKRAGPTLILERLTPQMLAAAYAAARVHALPSWYELPGLVSLEAAAHGCAVVVTENGTAPDYFGDTAHYCDPGHELSIRNAILAAYYCPVNPRLKEVVMKYTWDNSVDQTVQEYERATGISTAETPTVKTLEVGMFDMASGVSDFQETLEKGEQAAKSREYNLAHDHLKRAQQLNPGSVRAHRARGAVFMAENNIARAEECFTTALSLDGGDAKTLSGLGMCRMNAGKAEQAYDYFVRALKADPFQLVAILQMIECSYSLNRFDDLERILRTYLSQNPTDRDMRFCLAGCLLKGNKLGESREILESILSATPDHLGSQQLMEIIQERSSGANNREQALALTEPVKTSSSAAAPVNSGIERLEELKKQKRYDEVISQTAAMLQRTDISDGDRLRARILHAEGTVLTGNLEGAEREYNEILVASPQCARALCGKGAIAAFRGDLPGARELFERSLQIESDYDVALAGLGIMEQCNGVFERAWDLFTRALDKNPENTRALFGLIELGYRFRRLDELQARLSAYLEYHPADLEYVYALAGCLFAQNKLDEALTEINRITLFEPGNARALELRDVISKKREQRSGAEAR